MRRMEVCLNGDELKTILCRLEPGMSLTVTDEWAAKTIPGTHATRARELREMALQLGCAFHPEMGKQVFEKLEYPRTG